MAGQGTLTDRLIEAQLAEVEERRLHAQERHAEAKEKHAAELAAISKAGGTEGLQDFEEDEEGELTPQLTQLAGILLGVPRSYLIAISANKFKAENLAKLRAGLYNEDTARQIVIGKSGLVSKRTIAALKDFGSTINDAYTEGMMNWIIAIATLHGSKQPDLVPAIIQFYQKVQELAKIYIWSAVLEMAITYHNYLINTGATLTPSSWSAVPQTWTDTYCGPTKLKGFGGSVSKAHAASGSKTLKEKQPNDESVICRNFNSKNGCNWVDCKREHTKLRDNGKQD